MGAAVVQRKHSSFAFGGSSGTAAMPGNITGTNPLIVAFVFRDTLNQAVGSYTFTITDTVGTTYTQKASFRFWNTTVSRNSVCVIYAGNPPAGSAADTITCSVAGLGSSKGGGIFFYEVSGIDQSLTVESTATGSLNGLYVTTQNLSNCTFTDKIPFLVSCMDSIDAAPTTVAAGNIIANCDTDNTSNDNFFSVWATDSRILSPFNFSFTDGQGGSASGWTGLGVAFLSGAAAAAGPPFSTNYGAIPALITPPTNIGQDYVVTGIFTTLFQQLQAWTHRVALAINNLLPNGQPPIPVSFGGTGDIALTAHGPLVGEGTKAVVAVMPGNTGIPLVGVTGADPQFGTASVGGGGTGLTTGTSGGVPYFSSTTTMASSARLTLNGIVLGGGAGAAPVSMTGTSGGVPYFNSGTTVASSGTLGSSALVLGGGAGSAPTTASQWTINGGGQILEDNANASVIPGAITGAVGAQLIFQQVDGTGCAISQVGYGALNNFISWRAENTGASPTATGAGVVIQQFTARGFDGTSWTGALANITLAAINQTSSTDHSSQIQLNTVATGSAAAPSTVATFKNSGCSILGTNTNDNAAAGFVGEYTSAIVLIGSEVNISTAVANITSLNLTAGDWDVWGEVWVDTSTGAATVSGSTRAAINTASAVIPTTPADGTARTQVNFAPLASGTDAIGLPVGPIRASLNTTTTYFLVANCAVSAGTANGYGKLVARRVR